MCSYILTTIKLTTTFIEGPEHLIKLNNLFNLEYSKEDFIYSVFKKYFIKPAEELYNLLNICLSYELNKLLYFIFKINSSIYIILRRNAVLFKKIILHNIKGDIYYFINDYNIANDYTIIKNLINNINTLEYDFLDYNLVGKYMTKQNRDLIYLPLKYPYDHKYIRKILELLCFACKHIRVKMPKNILIYIIEKLI